MNSDFYHLCGKLVDSRYVRQGQEGRQSRQSMIDHLLRHRKIPEESWDDETIRLLFQELSLMDTNNFVDKCGAGEREGRVFSSLVAKRHFGLSHGIGRSGDVTAIQPKAAGSSVMAQLANALALDALRISGVIHCQACFVVPVATGMSIVLALLTLKSLRPHATHVIWPRIDQKSCFKAIGTAGLTPVVIEPLLVGDQLQTNGDGIRRAINDLPDGPASVVCILTTTSCFAPRAPDNLVEVGEIAKDLDVPHVVNNAYGVQSSKCTHLIEQAGKSQRLDVFVQSTDKNFMVPVGGAIVAGFDSELISKIAKTYPGRASATPSVDLLITLLSMGRSRYKLLLKERKENYDYLKDKLVVCAAANGERLLHTPGNPISMAITLTLAETKHDSRNDEKLEAKQDESVSPPSRELETELGSMLFTRCVSGARAVSSRSELAVNGHSFLGWGAHHERYPDSYLTAGVGIGMERQEVDVFVQRLDKVFQKWKKR